MIMNFLRALEERQTGTGVFVMVCECVLPDDLPAAGG